jgi:hypothetical protein
MYHKFAVDWPCLSFDPVPDRLGAGRADFPLTLTLVAGTQADTASANTVDVMRFSALRKTQKAPRAAGEEEEDDDEEEEEEDEDEAAATGSAGGRRSGGAGRGRPSVTAERAPHDHTVNRVRVMPQEPHVVATWSETGRVHLFDVRAQLRALDARRAGAGAAPAGRHAGAFQSLAGHTQEGFALAWSGAAPGRLASGDCAGRILVWDVEAKALAGASPVLRRGGARARTCSRSVAATPILPPLPPAPPPPALRRSLDLPLLLRRAAGPAVARERRRGLHLWLVERGGHCLEPERGHRLCELRRGRRGAHLGHARARPPLHAAGGGARDGCERAQLEPAALLPAALWRG